MVFCFCVAQNVTGLPTVNNMSQTPNLLANGGTTGGNVGCYSYPSGTQNIGTSQVNVVTLQQRNVASNIAALQASRFSTSTTSVTGTISEYCSVLKSAACLSTEKIDGNFNYASRSHRKR